MAAIKDKNKPILEKKKKAENQNKYLCFLSVTYCCYRMIALVLFIGVYPVGIFAAQIICRELFSDDYTLPFWHLRVF